MTARRSRVLMAGAVGLTALCFALVCCQQPTTRFETTASPNENEPAAAAPVATARPAQSPPIPQPASETSTQRAAEPAAAPEARGISMDQPEEPPEPPPPPFLAVVEEIDAAQRSTVTAELHPPRKLVLDTDNVKRLRLTRERLPLTRNRSIVLQIDGQGIEWTRKHVAIELERSAAGEWTVIKRRPDKP